MGARLTENWNGNLGPRLLDRAIGDEPLHQLLHARGVDTMMVVAAAATVPVAEGSGTLTTPLPGALLRFFVCAR